MRIGIDARLLTYRRGMGNYVYNLLVELAKLPGDERYILYVDDLRAAEHSPQNPRFVVKRLAPRFYPLWEQVSLPLAVARDRPDILHCPANTAPLFLPKRLKQVLTIHDVMYMLPTSVLPRTPSPYQRAGRLYYRCLAPQAAKRAACIVTDSEKSKRDITEKLHISCGNILVVYAAGDAICRRFDDSSQVVAVKERYAIEGPYVFALGALDPRKNTENILRAFARLRQLYTVPIQLVLAGLSSKAQIRFHALGSKLGLDAHAIANALLRVIADPGLQSKMSIASLMAARKLTWRRTAEETVAVYHKIYSAGCRESTQNL
jgi:glycosyltransferase involved in cell wall biosynthesis